MRPASCSATRGTHGEPEQEVRVVVEVCEGPRHPLVRTRPFRDAHWPQHSVRVLRGDVSDDGIAFPHHSVTVLQGRYAAVGVHGGEARVVQPAVGASQRHVCEGLAGLAERPKNLLHVVGRAPAVKGQHGIFSVESIPAPKRAKKAMRGAPALRLKRQRRRIADANSESSAHTHRGFTRRR